MRSLSCTSHGDVSDCDDRNTESFLFENSKLKQVVTDSYKEPIYPAERQQPVVYLYLVAFGIHVSVSLSDVGIERQSCLYGFLLRERLQFQERLIEFAQGELHFIVKIVALAAGNLH